MNKRTKIILCIVASLFLILIITFREQLTAEGTRIDLNRIRTSVIPPKHLHSDNSINIPDVIIYDISGTNSRFISTTIEWDFEGELNGETPHVEFTTITPEKELISSVSITESTIEFVPITDQGRGTAAITISVGEESRTVFVRIYDLSLTLIALEFDDGPSRYTEQTVTTLNDAGISASFYLTGRNFHDIAHEFVGVEIYPEVALFTLDSGHHIGNHTYSHPWIGVHSGDFPEEFPEGQYKPWWQYTEEDVVWQVQRADEAIYAALGIIPTYYAPIYFFNHFNHYIRDIGKTISFRNFAIDSGDWWWESTAEEIAEVVLSAPSGSTVVLHDIYQRTADAMEMIVNSPEAQHIQFVTGFEMDMILGR